MFGSLRERLDPSGDFPNGFGIPAEYTELRRQMALIPLKYDEEGRMTLPPKQKRDPKSTQECLREILGCSPDELDSVVVSLHALSSKPQRARAGA